MEEKRNEKRDEKRKSNNRTVIIVLSVIVGLGILSNFFGEKEPQSDNNATKQEETAASTTEADTPSTTETTAEVTTEAKTETPEEYKNSCQSMDYKTIARQPELYEGMNIKVTGEVWQVVEEGDDALYQINIDKTEYGYDYNSSVQIIYKDAKNNFRVLEDDIITVYGEYKGIVSYTTVLGAKQSIPQISAKYIELQPEENTESN